jgi:CubicO group peptidase (beta-lactamase class C family)
MHGDDILAMQSVADETPAAEYAAAVEQARAVVQSFVREHNLPGLSLAVGVGGEIVWAEGFGWADIEARQPVTPRTRFRIGGIAMPMTAAAVGLLLERGELDLDLPARRYVPAFPEKPWPVTVRELMGHVAGIRHPDDEEMLYRRSACLSATDSLALYADDRLQFEPGTRFRYSSYGWALVGAVVENAAGEPFLDFMQRELFDRLAMQQTVLDDPDRPAAGTTTFYWPFAARDTATGIEHANNPNDTCIQGAGALLSTPSDLVRFGAAMIDGRMLRPETLAQLLTPLTLASGESTGHGLGWRAQAIPLGTDPEPTRVFSHDAVAAGGTASLLTAPERKLVVAVTANVSYAPDLPLLTGRIADLLATRSGI